MIINKFFLEGLLKKAENSNRKRYAFLLHNGPDSPSQRMLNALMPGTVVPIHRHSNTDETYSIIKGRIRIKYYDVNKVPIDEILLSPSLDNIMLVIPKGQWHTVEVLEPSVIYEVCDGPYNPLCQEDIL